MAFETPLTQNFHRSLRSHPRVSALGASALSVRALLLYVRRCSAHMHMCVLACVSMC